MSRIRKPFIREEGKKNARIIIIATEGRETERIYFEALAQEYNSTEVHVKVLKRDNNDSSPDIVIKTLD